jgi:hypothetical protein
LAIPVLKTSIIIIIVIIIIIIIHKDQAHFCPILAFPPRPSNCTVSLGLQFYPSLCQAFSTSDIFSLSYGAHCFKDAAHLKLSCDFFTSSQI